MPKLSVIIASDSHWEHIDDTLTSLENQTVTDFEVIFIRPQIDKALADSITEFCMKAEGRFDITEEDALVPKLLNRGFWRPQASTLCSLPRGLSAGGQHRRLYRDRRRKGGHYNRQVLAQFREL